MRVEENYEKLMLRGLDKLFLVELVEKRTKLRFNLQESGIRLRDSKEYKKQGRKIDRLKEKIGVTMEEPFVHDKNLLSELVEKVKFTT